MAKPQPAPESAPETVDAQNEGAILVRKLSPKTVMGRIVPPLKADGSPYVDEDGVRTKFPDTVLYTVFGQSHGIKTGTGDNGPWCAFLGAFEAIRSKDAQRFQSGQCFVPKAVEDLLAAALKASQKGDDNASVEFAIEVGIKFSEAPVGYEFTVKNLVKTTNADPLADLRKRLYDARPQLALASPK